MTYEARQFEHMNSTNLTKTKSSTLTGKQQRFVQEYVIGWNATQAAIKAGYSEKTAKEQASQLLTKPNVMAAVEAKKQEIAEKADIKAQDVIRDLIRLKDMCMELDGNGKPKDAPTAARCLDLLGRYRNLWGQDKRDGSGDNVMFVIKGLSDKNIINGEVVNDETLQKALKECEG